MEKAIRASLRLGTVALMSLPLFPQGNSDVFLSSIGRDGDKIVLASPVKISERTGYNNQPSFHPDGRGVFYSSADGPQTDIFLYIIGEKRNGRLTSTFDSEYSPLVTPAGTEFSVIQLVLAEGPRKGAQPRLVGARSERLEDEQEREHEQAGQEGHSQVPLVIQAQRTRPLQKTPQARRR